MITYTRRENVTIDRTFAGIGMCGPEHTLHLKGDGFDVPLTVFWGTKNVDSTATVVSEITAVAGAKNWEQLRGRPVQALLYTPTDSPSAYACDAIEDIMGGRRFSVREHFEATWQKRCWIEFTDRYGIRDTIRDGYRTVNAKIVGTFLGREGNVFRVALQLRNQYENLDGWLDLCFDDEIILARGIRVDSAIMSLRVAVRAQAWENLHGQVVRAIVNSHGEIVGIGNLIHRTFFTQLDFWNDSQLRDTPPAY